MNKKLFEKFVISQVALLFRNDTCLILQANIDTTFSEKWGLPGGRIDEGEAERGDEAFGRELQEELGFENFVTVGMVDFETWYNNDGLARAAIVRYVQNDADDIQLSDEHMQYAWITESEIDNFEYAWANMPKILKKGFEFHRKLKK
jgi:8-oxo-dGTP diphosphatase